MTSIIITLILNLLVGTPTDSAKEKDKKTKENTEEVIKAKGGSGAWTNVDKDK